MASQVASASMFLRLMSASVAAANHAGTIIREIMRKGDLGIVVKGVNDLQTEADRSVQRCIAGSLLKQFPKITVIGEETLEKIENEEELIINLNDSELISAKCPENLDSLKEEDVVVWVDPMDGTQEYTQGLLDHVTVLIGLAVNGKAVGGVIHQPYYNYQKEEDYTKLGRTMWGIVGVGGWGIQPVQPPRDKRIIATTRSHSNPVVKAMVDALKPDDVLRVGGAGHKVLLLIEGKAHAYVMSKGTKKWDTCAPEALLHSFGGKLTDVHGQPLQYHAEVEHMNSGGVLASYLESAHEWYTSHMPQEARDALH